jgi:cytoskeletal protein CcmA (bactofilin family)
MAIFTKEQQAAGETKSAPTTGGGEGSLSMIAAGMKVTGDIDTDGVVKIEGKVEGSVRAGRQVLVGRQGEVVGDIMTREAVIGGKVQGTVTASERVEVQGTSTVIGDINTKAIAVVEGGKINGSIRISDTAVSNGRQAEGRHAEGRHHGDGQQSQKVAGVR